MHAVAPGGKAVMPRHSGAGCFVCGEEIPGPLGSKGGNTA